MNTPLHHASGVTTWPVPAGAMVAAAPLPEAGVPVVAPATAVATAPPAADATEVANPVQPDPVPTAGSPADPATTAEATTLSTTTVPPAKFAPADGGAGGAIGGTVAALLLVVALILVLGRFARRLPGVAGGSHAALRVVGSLSLGPRERIVVVDVGGTQLLLSTGAQGTRTLHTLDAPLPEAPPASPAFAQLLSRQLRRSVGLEPAAGTASA
ncbi:hypothetical protein GCM10028862_20140 [Luteimonas pelagia]